jgi:taurine dioxygenase
MRLEKLPHLGAEVIDFTGSAADFSAARAALIEHHLLLFRGRTLSPGQQIDFTLGFGDKIHAAAPRLRFLAAYPPIFRMSNHPKIGNHNNGCYWHCDGQDLADPTAISVHHIIKTTPDSVTMYVDLARAWQALERHEQEELDQIGCVAKSGTFWPLVIRHPVTRAAGLYPNLDPLGRLVGHGGRAAPPELVDGLRAHLTDLAYGHEWLSGDLIVVDNFAVAHCAQPADPRRLRILHRTTIPLSGVHWS